MWATSSGSAPGSGLRPLRGHRRNVAADPVFKVRPGVRYVQGGNRRGSRRDPDAVMLNIRRGVMADLDVIVEFNARLASESEGVELDRDRLRSGVRNALADDRRAFYLIAESSGVAVGQLMVTFEWSDWRDGEFWWLQSVYVRPEFRRQGVLGALYARVLELAEEKNVCGIRLYVERGNAAAKAAYLKFGIKPTVFDMYEHDFVITRAEESGHDE